MPAFIQRPDGSAVYFDLTDEERHVGMAEVTKYPVEDGPEVADHIRPVAAPLMLRCTISNTPLVPSGNQPGTTPGEATPNDMGTTTVDATPYQAPFNPLSAVVNPIGSVMNAIGNALSSHDYHVDVPVVVFNTPFNAPVDTLFLLNDIKEKGEILTIFTSIAEYDGMVLTKFELIRNASTGTGAEVELLFEPLTVVTTTTAAAPQPTEPRGNVVKKKGAQGPKAPDPPKNSIAWTATHS